MELSGENDDASGWRRGFIERHFDRDLADRLRAALGRVWRTSAPTLRSERTEKQRNTYLSWWRVGLAGLGAEAEDPQWAQKLTPAEARLACRYVPLELNGFPSWLDDLAAAHPHAVMEVLGGELAKDLSRSGEDGSDGWLLQGVAGASSQLSRLFLPQIRVRLDEHGERIGHNQAAAAGFDRLTRVVGILLGTGDAATADHLRKMATERLADGLRAPLAGVWLPTLMRLDPSACVAALETSLADPELRSPGRHRS